MKTATNQQVHLHVVPHLVKLPPAIRENNRNRMCGSACGWKPEWNHTEGNLGNSKEMVRFSLANLNSIRVPIINITPKALKNKPAISGCHLNFTRGAWKLVSTWTLTLRPFQIMSSSCSWNLKSEHSSCKDRGIVILAIILSNCNTRAAGYFLSCTSPPMNSST